MNIKDELDAMLDGLKNGGAKPDAQNNSPKSVRKIPPRKSEYDNMSVDELLQALSDTKKQNNSDKRPTAPVPPKTIDRAESGIPQNLIDMLSTSNSGTPKKKVVSNNSTNGSARKAVIKSTAAPVSHDPVKQEKTDIISEVLQEIKTANQIRSETSEAVPKTPDNPTADLPENIALISEAKESAAERESEIYGAPAESSDNSQSAEEASAEPDSVIASAMTAEESAPKKRRKLFSGLRAKLAGKNGSAEELSPEPDIESVPDINCEPQPDEVSINVPETDVEPESSETPSAAELIDAALAANEEVQMEISGESAPSETNNIIPSTENTEPDASVADELIAGIRTDNADDIADSDDDNSPADETIDGIHTDDADNIADSDDDNSPADETIAGIHTDNADDIDDSDDDNSPADGLIADIRKDAAEAIAEISDDKPQESVDAEVPDEAGDNPEESIEIDVTVDEQKKRGRLVTALEKILEENPGTIADERSEKTEPDEIDVSVDKHSSGKLKKHLYAVLGVVFTALAVVGLISSVKFGLSHFRSFTAGENKKDSFSDVIYPAVIMDIESFSSPSELSSEQIISAAIWSLVMSADDMEKYEKTFDVISVPAVDVEAYAAKLFGDAMPPLTHATVGSGELKFYYNEETKSYNVPVNPITFTYEPSITSVSKTDNEYTVTVDYIKELPAWMKNSENFSPDVSKTVEFKLTEKDGSYVISSMTVIKVNSVI